MSRASSAAAPRRRPGRARRRAAGSARRARASRCGRRDTQVLDPAARSPDGHGAVRGCTGRRGCGRPATRTDRRAGWPGRGTQPAARIPVATSPSASATRASPRAEMPSQQGSPSWQARANAWSSTSAAVPRSPRGQRCLALQRLGPRQEGQPVVLLRPARRSATGARRHHPRSPRNRLIRPSIDSGEGLSAWCRRRRGVMDRPLSRGGGLAVVRPVALHRTEVGRRLGHHGRGAVGEPQGVVQPQLGPVVAGAQEVDVAELGPARRHGIGQLVGDGDLVGFVEAGQTLLVEPAEGVDQGLGEDEP